MMSDSERISDALDVIYPPIPQEKIDEYSDTLKTLARLEYVLAKEASTSALSIEMIKSAQQQLSAKLEYALKQSTGDEAGGIGDA